MNPAPRGVLPLSRGRHVAPDSVGRPRDHNEMDHRSGYHLLNLFTR